jgi:valyl-tRNA synthetase
VEAVKKGRIKFHPKRWTKVYLNWMQNIQDWCISRQIWWGHRLPVYYCQNCIGQANGSRFKVQGSRGKLKTKNKQQTTNNQQGVIVSRIKPDKCPACGSADIYQDEDVLDTWFSSWLWPFATFGWPFQLSAISYQSSAKEKLTAESRKLKADLDYFYPTSVLVTAPEIIFFWVARMIMAGLEFVKDVPFRDVYIHGTVRDIEGKKMSKSLGNIIDPLEIISEFGTDALRFSLISITAQGQDVFLSREKFEQGRNFANKIWNASRLILMNLEPAQAHVDLCVFFKKEDIKLENRWILSRFYSLLKEVNANLDSFKFNEAANLLYGFFWHEFCDWYLEIIKADIRHPQNQVVMRKVLEKFLRILHPFMPFLTEDVWQKLNNQLTTNDQRLTTSIMVQPWPHVQEQIIDKKNEALMQPIFDVITTVRNMRAELEIPLQEKMAVAIYSPHKKEREVLSSLAPIIKRLAKAETLQIKEAYARGKGQFTTVLKDMHIVILLSGIIDTAIQQKKIEEKLTKAAAEIKRKNDLLGNANFSKNAPEEIVEKEKSSLNELNELVKKLKAVKNALQ